MLIGSNDTRSRFDGSIFYVDSNLEMAASLTTHRSVYDSLTTCHTLHSAQISSSHFGWLLLTEECKHCWRDIFQCSSCSQLRSDRCFVDKVKRYGIDCMCS